MKNIFEFATKELSQDAFLCWLIENYNSENQKVNTVAIDVLSKFSFQIAPSKIVDLKTYRQWKYIDVLVQFEYDGKIICIAIEDKTFSEEHNQLKKYNLELESLAKRLSSKLQKEVEFYKVFYKTAILTSEEADRIKNSSKDSDKWHIFDITEIANLFEKYSDTGSELLDSYIQHVLNLNTMFNHYETIPFDQWTGNNIILKRYCDINIKSKTDAFTRSEVYQGKYTAAYIQKTTKDNILVELAFFFRDSGFSAWIKCWKSNKQHNERDEYLIAEAKKCVPDNLDIKWDRRAYVNIIMRTKTYPNELHSFNELDKWVDKCISDFENFFERLQINYKEI